MENKNEIALYRAEIGELQNDKQSFTKLMDITFKGLKPETAMVAMLEGRMNGFTLQNFFQKDVYAVPFAGNYSLVTSIDWARKIGQKSGVCGVTAPIYTEDDKGNVLTCEITVKKSINGIIGEFTALVYFKEYYTGHKKEDGTIKKNQYGDVKPTLWDTKPRTMISKVAEMHALRKACPEELKKAYVEEEMEREKVTVFDNEDTKEEKKAEDTRNWKQKCEDCKTVEELGNVWVEMPASLKAEKTVIDFVNELKIKLTANNTVEAEVIE